MSGNMELWSKVSETDPDHTKGVSQRGGFTAIDAHYQIQSATKAFGPIGIGWGYECEYLFQGTAVICLVTFWHGDRSNKFGPIAGCAEMTGKRLDTDAPKKAATDGITKALSQLGFNADVFLGKFDDNKYVSGLKSKKLNDCLAEYQGADSNTQTALWNSYTQEQQAFITNAFNQQG